MTKLITPLLVVVALALGVWWLMGDDSSPVATPKPSQQVAEEKVDGALASGDAAKPESGKLAQSTEAEGVEREDGSQRGVLSGAVTDIPGSVLEGIVVHAIKSQFDFEDGSEFTLFIPGLSELPAIDDPKYRTETDVDGRYRLELPPGNYHVAARGKGFRPERSKSAKVVADQESHVDLILSRGLSVSGWVATPAGDAVVGAVVSTGSSRGGDIGVMLFGAGGNRSVSTVEAVTDDNGAFVLEGVAPGKVSLTAQHDDWATSEPVALQVDANTVGVHLQMRPGASIAGVVLDPTAQPSAGIAVALLEPGFNNKPITTQTDDAGHFEFPRLAPGRFKLAVDSEPYPFLISPLIRVEQAQNVDDLVLQLNTATVVKGRLVDPDGVAVAGGALRLVDHSRAMGADGIMLHEYATLEGRSGEDGVFEIPRVDAAIEFEGSANHRDFLETSFAVPFDSTATSLEVGDVMLSWGSIVRGTVSDEQGGGIANATVLLMSPGSRQQNMRSASVSIGGGGHVFSMGDNAQRSKTNSDGFYEFRGLAPGDYEVEARAQDFVKTRGDAFTLEEHGERQENLTLAAGIALLGKVVDGQGLPLAGVKVVASARDEGRVLTSPIFAPGMMGEGSGSKSAVTDSEGTFKIPGVELRPYDLRATLSGYSEGGIDGFDPQSGAALVELLPQALITGVVMNAAREPIHEFDVKVTASKDAASSAATEGFSFDFAGMRGTRKYKDAQGEFAYQGLDGGVYDIEVSTRGYKSSSRQRVRIESGGEKRFEFFLDVGGTLRGRALDADGSPIEGARLVRGTGGRRGGHIDMFVMASANGVISDVTGGESALATTDAEGWFEVGGFEPGESTVTLSARGFRKKTFDKLVMQDNQVHDLGEFKLDKGAAIVGRLLNADGDGVTGTLFLVPVRDGELIEREQKNAFANPDGDFRFDDLDKGSYELRWLYIGGVGGAMEQFSRRLEVEENKDYEEMLRPE